MVPPRKQIDGTNERQSMNVHLRTLTLAVLCAAASDAQLCCAQLYRREGIQFEAVEYSDNQVLAACRMPQCHMPQCRMPQCRMS